MMWRIIRVEEVVGTNLLWQNPGICLISPLYSQGFKVVDRGNEYDLDEASDYVSLLTQFNYGRFKRRLFILSLLHCFLFSGLISLFGSLFRFGTTLLITEPGFWKYMALQFSILSAFLFGFCGCFEIHYFNKEWTQRCILNGRVLNPERKEKCGFFTAQQDLHELLRRAQVSTNNHRQFPYGWDYFTKVDEALRSLMPEMNVILEYNRLLSRINGAPTKLRVLSSFLIGVAIEVFTLIDIFEELHLFRINIIVSSIAVFLISFLAAGLFVHQKYSKTQVKLDALLYLYSYMFLELPINRKTEPHYRIDAEKRDIDDEEEWIKSEITKLSEHNDEYIFYRLVVTDEKGLTIYGIKPPRKSSELSARP